MNTKKGFAGVILIIAVVVLILTVLIYYFLVTNKKVVSETGITSPSPSAETIANWKVYASQKMGFEIKAPPEFQFFPDIPVQDAGTRDLISSNLVLKKSPDEIEQQRQRLGADQYWGGGHDYWISIMIDSWTSLESSLWPTFQDWMDEDIGALNSLLENPSPQETINLGGETALRISHTKSSDNWFLTSIYVQRNKRMYKITGVVDTDKEKEDSQLLDQILSTFKFMD